MKNKHHLRKSKKIDITKKKYTTKKKYKKYRLIKNHSCKFIPLYNFNKNLKKMI